MLERMFMMSFLHLSELSWIDMQYWQEQELVKLRDTLWITLQEELASKRKMVAISKSLVSWAD